GIVLLWRVCGGRRVGVLGVGGVRATGCEPQAQRAPEKNSGRSAKCVHVVGSVSESSRPVVRGGTKAPAMRQRITCLGVSVGLSVGWALALLVGCTCEADRPASGPHQSNNDAPVEPSEELDGPALAVIPDGASVKPGDM